MDLQDTICQCQHLQSLHIAYDDDRKGMIGDPTPSSFLMDLSAALPNLAMLHWRDAKARRRTSTRHIFSAFNANPFDRPGLPKTQAAETLAGPRLRVLQAEECSFAAASALPASLQVLSIMNGYFSHVKRLELMLAPCAALRELYLRQFCNCDADALDLPLIATSCPRLRVLVVHVLGPSHGDTVRTPSCTHHDCSASEACRLILHSHHLCAAGRCVWQRRGGFPRA